MPNTLRQMLIYESLGFKVPTFGHVSLILAPDRSKLSKRHGATRFSILHGIACWSVDVLNLRFPIASLPLYRGVSVSVSSGQRATCPRPWSTTSAC